MNTQELKTTLERYYNKVELEPNEIYRCEKAHDGKTYQVIYFDNSEKLRGISDNDNLSDYVRKVLISDYFNHPGSTQWNYYYAFLTGNSEIKKEKAFVYDNTEFARKFIIEREKIDGWLKDEYEIDDIHKKDTAPHLASIWQTQFEKNDYPFIFNKNSSAGQGWKDILKGETVTDTESLSNAEETDNVKSPFGFISEINLEKYRLYPQVKNFKFGRVNLIYAPNGFGKTSLLEAIEAYFCGYNLRAKERISRQNTNINILLAGESEMRNIAESIPRNEIIVKNKYYYNSPSQHKIPEENLAENFSKFNFFHSDAAFQLAQDDPKEILQIFEKIIFGFSFNQMQKRLKEYSDEIRKGIKREKAAEEELRIATESKERELKELKIISEKSNKKTYEEFSKKIYEIPWKVKPEFKDDKIEIVDFNIDVLVDDLKFINESLSSSANKSLEGFEKIREVFIAAKQQLMILRKGTIDCDEKIRKYSADYKSYILMSTNLEQYFLYIQSGARELLRDATEKINVCKYAIDKIISANTPVLDEAIQIFSGNNTSISIFTEDLNKNIKESTKRVKDLKQELSNIQANASQIQIIISDLKQNGLKYIEKYPDAIICPLCNHNHGSKDVLRREIDRIGDKLDQTESISKIQNNLENLQLENVKQKRVKDLLSEIVHSYELLFEKEVAPSEKLNDICSKLTIEISKLTILNDQQRKLIAARDNFRKKNMTEEGLHLLEDLIEEQIKSALQKSEDEIKKLIADFQAKASIEQSRSNSLISEKKGLEDKISSLRKNLAPNVKIEQFESHVDSKVLLFDRTEIHFKNIRKIIKLSSGQNLLELQEVLQQLSKIYSQIKSLREEQDRASLLLGNTEKDYIYLSNQLSESKKRVERGVKFEGVFNEITEEYNKEKYLSEFFADNEKELISIYKQIHTPKDFDGIRFNRASNEIQLHRIETDEWTNIKFISSGQRTALALSIFLSFNRQLKNGPKLLIFDDPIAFIDDINSLTFLDYLRESINMDKNRQLFFATANEGLAFLFKQKFDYLGLDKDLFVYKLGREENQIKSNNL